MIVLGHPTGTPFSHQAAHAYLERGVLEAFVTAWFPTKAQLRTLQAIPGLGSYARRISRRRYEPLAGASIVDGFWSEVPRLLQRLWDQDNSEKSFIAGNMWLMKVLSEELCRPGVTAVHGYEDCSLLPFQTAKKRGVRCIYDLPIGYAAAWHKIRGELAERYSDWLPVHEGLSRDGASFAQKAEELRLADIIVVPSEFVRSTIDADKRGCVVVVPFGSRPQLEMPGRTLTGSGTPIRFLFAGTISVRKGVPTLLEAWEQGKFVDQGAELWLVGTWNLRRELQESLPKGVFYKGVQSRQGLDEIYGQCHVLVFPSFFEGFALVINEALSMGLPVITTIQSGVPSDLIDEQTGRIIEAGNTGALIRAISFYIEHRARWEEFSHAARLCVRKYTWENYRRTLVLAIEGKVV